VLGGAGRGDLSDSVSLYWRDAHRRPRALRALNVDFSGWKKLLEFWIEQHKHEDVEILETRICASFLLRFEL
jgi:hypothetical protein